MGPVGVRFRPVRAHSASSKEVVGGRQVDEVVHEGGETQIIDIEATPNPVSHTSPHRLDEKGWHTWLGNHAREVADHGANLAERAATKNGQTVAVIGEPHGRVALLAIACQPAVAEAFLASPSPEAKLSGGLRILVPEALEEVPSKYPKPKRSKHAGRRA